MAKPTSLRVKRGSQGRHESIARPPAGVQDRFIPASPGDFDLGSAEENIFDLNFAVTDFVKPNVKPSDNPDAALLDVFESWLREKRSLSMLSAKERAWLRSGPLSNTRPRRPGAPPSFESEANPERECLPLEAQQVFGELPSGLNTKLYERSSFPDEWFSNPAIVRAARRIVYAYKTRDKKVKLKPSGMSRVRAANRFMKQYERRQKALSPTALAGAEPR
jgi:hypothetical protein